MRTKIDFKTLSLQDALDLAILIEEEAQDRYEKFAELLGDRYAGDATDFFRMMAQNEAKHGQQLAARRQQLFKNAPSRVNRDQIEDVEAPGYDRPRAYMSPRQALDLAMESEIKAHDFFQAALAHVRDPQVAELFTELKAEEIHHQELLQEQMKNYPDTDGPDLGDDDIDEPPSL